MNAAETIANAKKQIAEIQSLIDRGVLMGPAAEKGREEIGNLAMIAVTADLLGNDEGDGGCFSPKDFARPLIE